MSSVKVSTGEFTPPASERATLTAGFMTIELLISVLIMSVMSTIVLSANSNMSARLQVDNLAHMIALSIRETQTRALSAIAPVGANSASEIPGYGVYISTAGNNQVQIFTDSPVGGGTSYNRDTSENYGPPRVLGQGHTISGISAIDAGSGSQITSPQAVSIFFRRPRPDAEIFYGTSPTANPSLRASQASITIRSPKAGVTKTITVTSTGQISVR